MPRLVINLLGPMRVDIDGHPNVAFGTDKTRALLAYLLLEGTKQPLRREMLACLLWPEYSKALGNLRQTLFQLRRVLGDQQNPVPHLLVTRHDVQFNRASDYWLDAHAFDALLIETRTHHPNGSSLCAACCDRLSSALDLYRGDLLAGLSLPESGQFEWWLLDWQERYHGQALEETQQLVGHFEKVADYGKAAKWARKEVALEPWNQLAHRRLMRSLARNGQRRVALSHYEHLRQMWLQETGSLPSVRTTRLYQQIKAGMLDQQMDKVERPIHPSSSASDTRPIVMTHFTGFEKELAWLDARLAEAVGGRGQIVFVTGEAGSGKSTLLGEFARQAIHRHPDLLVIAGSCDAHAGPGIPYLPVREALRQLVYGTVTGHRGRFIGHRRSLRILAAQREVVSAMIRKAPSLLQLFTPGDELIQLIREFGDLDADLQAGMDLFDPAQAVAKVEPRRMQPSILFDEVVDFLFSLSREHSLLLILDDLHWADRGTINLLFHLGRRLADSRILLAATYRPEAVSAGPPAHLAEFMDRHPLRSIVLELQQQLGDIRLDLDSSDGLAFVHAYLDREPNRLDESFRKALYRHTRGNPLFVVELLRQLDEEGQLVRDEHGGLMVGQDLVWNQLPPRVESIISERIEQLPEPVRWALEAASIQGQDFITEVVELVLPLEKLGQEWAGEIASRQHRLIQAVYWQRLGDRQLSQYRFHHFLIQQYLYQSLDGMQRARLHEATGRTLESLYGDQSEEYAGQLVRHFESAGVWKKAVDYLMLAGQRAYALSANEEAINFFQRGIRLLIDSPPDEERDRIEMKLLLAQTAPLLAKGGYAAPGIRKAANRIIHLSQRLDEPIHIFPARILLLVYHAMLAEYVQARRLVDQLLKQARTDQHPLHLMQAHHFAGHLHFCAGEFEEALRQFDSALASNDLQVRSFLTTQFIGGNIWITSLIRKAWTLWFLGYPDQSEAILKEAMDRFEQVGQNHDIAFALGMGICPLLYIRRDFGQAEIQAERLLQLAAEKDLPYFIPFAQVVLGSVLTKRGSKVEGLYNIRSGVEEYRRSGQKVFLSLCLSILAEALDDDEEAGRVLNDSFRVVDATGERFFEAELNRIRGDFLVKQAAKPNLIEEHYRRAVYIARQQHAKSLELRAAIGLAQILRRQGQVKGACQLLTESYSWFSEGFDTADLREARALLQEIKAPHHAAA